MTKDQILAFVQRHRLAVQASVADDGAPQAAVVGVATTDDFEVVFDTLAGSRKCANLRSDPRIALVIGWDMKEACTVQLEGIADEPSGEELERLKRRYFQVFPDGVERQWWPALTYFRVRPTWLRWSDFSGDEPVVLELSGADLAR